MGGGEKIPTVKDNPTIYHKTFKHAKQVTIQTWKTREGTQRGTALERPVVVRLLWSLNRF
jgi:hypothetical protein